MKIRLIQKYSIVRYIFISLFTAAIEAEIGFLLMKQEGFHIIGANTFSVLIGAILHYLLISKKVFNKSYNKYTASVYLVTFFLGIVLQNIVIFYSYEYVLNCLNPYIQFMGSKFLSITIPFIVVYSVRKKLYLSRG